MAHRLWSVVMSDWDDDQKDLTEMNAVFAVVKVAGKTRVAELE
jgi:hypothetical protein